MSSKQSGLDLGSGTGVGVAVGWKSSKWGPDDHRGVEDSRELDYSSNSNSNSNSQKDKRRNSDRDRVVIEARTEDVDDSAEIVSYFEGLNTSKSKRVESGGPVMTRPVRVSEDARGAEGGPSRGGSAREGDRKGAYGMRMPLREVKRIVRHVCVALLLSSSHNLCGSTDGQ
jgi:hypothetical protein